MISLHEISGPFSSFLSPYLEDQGGPFEDWDICALPGDGSKRHFWRLTSPHNGRSIVAMENPSEDAFSRRENRAYLKIGQHLRSKGLPIPRIHAFDLDRGWFILEDFGSESLQARNIQEEHPLKLYEKVLPILFRMQVEGVEGFDPGWTCQTETYDRSVMARYEAYYFRDSFLYRFLGMKASWPELEAPFKRLQDKASRAPTHFFLHRDFQSRNILVREDNLGIIDWQGGRFGPLAYDLASLIIDPYTDLRDPIRDHLYGFYLSLLKKRRSHWVDAFEASFPYLAIQRNLQILGAFSHLTLVAGKSYFKAYIPGAARSLYHLLKALGDPALMPLLELMAGIHESMALSNR
jgi:aminoglycoside/choline kinase family phosphotransferase